MLLIHGELSKTLPQIFLARSHKQNLSKDKKFTIIGASAARVMKQAKQCAYACVRLCVCVCVRACRHKRKEVLTAKQNSTCNRNDATHATRTWISIGSAQV